jgi:hypothetical protein
MSLYAAIDLHSSNSVLAALDETDKPLRQRRLPRAFRAFYDPGLFSCAENEPYPGFFDGRYHRPQVFPGV